MKSVLLLLAILVSLLFPITAKADESVVYRSTWENIGTFQNWWVTNHSATSFDFLDAKTNIAFSLFDSAVREVYLGQNIVHVKNGYTWGIRVTDDTSDFWGLFINTYGDWYFLDPDPNTLKLKKVRF